MHIVKHAKYIEGYKIQLTFDNKKIKTADLEKHLSGEIFEPLKDIAYFKTFKLNDDLDTISWENGADISPDFLYEIGN